MEHWIYVLVDSSTKNPFYIGMTYRPLAFRLKNHLECARNRPKTYKDRKINKLIREGNRIEIIGVCLCEDRVDACEKERAYISFARKSGIPITNVSAGGDCGPIFFGEDNPAKRLDVRQKISKSKLGKPRPDLSERNVRRSSKRIEQLSKGQIVAEYFSVSQAARTVGVCKTAISNCLTGRSKASCGFQWRFKK